MEAMDGREAFCVCAGSRGVQEEAADEEACDPDGEMDTSRGMAAAVPPLP